MSTKYEGSEAPLKIKELNRDLGSYGECDVALRLNGNIIISDDSEMVALNKSEAIDLRDFLMEVFPLG